MSLLNATPIAIPDTVLHQQLDTETVLFHLTTEQYYGLDEVGSRIWQLLKAQGRVEPIIPVLLEEYEVDEATLRSDIERLLGELTKTGLLQVEQRPRV